MNATQTFNALKSQKDGPYKKFQLVNVFGPALEEQFGLEPKKMSCAELEKQIAALLQQFHLRRT